MTEKSSSSKEKPKKSKDKSLKAKKSKDEVKPQKSEKSEVTKDQKDASKPEKKIKSKGKDDPRFQTRFDPRFKTMAKKEQKVEIDDRFKAVFTEKFAEPAKVDKFGQGRGATKATDVKKFYSVNGQIEEPTFEWNEQSSEEEESEAESEGVDDAVWEDDDVPRGEAQKRLAIMNCDWDVVGADDLFVLIHTHLEGSDRKVEKVTVYPSDYGIEKMDYESKHGPKIDGWEEKEEEIGGQVSEERANDAMRRYQKQKLKYYYAVAELDSAETGEYVYDQLDGLQIEHVFPVMGDFRFIPDEVEFSNDPSSVATGVPENYEPMTVNNSLSHCKVTCTWDEAPRQKQNWKKITNKEMADADMHAYLASSSESELDENNLESYRDNLLGSDSESQAEEETQDINVTFNPELEELANAIKKRAVKAARSGQNVEEVLATKEEKTPWAKFLEKKAKQKSEKREAWKKHNKDEDEAEVSDDDLLVPVKQKKKEKKAPKEEPVELAPQDVAELELMVGDEAKHMDLKARKKTRKQRLRDEKEKSKEDTFKLDMEDDRLSKLFSNPEFAIDPTNQAYQKTDAMTQVMTEKARRRKEKKNAELAATREAMTKPVETEDAINIFGKRKSKGDKKDKKSKGQKRQKL